MVCDVRRRGFGPGGNPETVQKGGAAMTYYATFGDLQQELKTYFQDTGKKLQFHEAVDRLAQKGLLRLSQPSDCRNDVMFGQMDTADFNRIVDEISFPVNPSSALRTDVNEDEMIPQVRDVFIIRHPRYTRPFLHKHNYVELDYVAEGSCRLYYEGERRTLGVGEMCVIAPGSHHDVEIADESTVYCIMLRYSTFETGFFSFLRHDDALALFFRTMLQDGDGAGYLIFRTENYDWMRVILQNALGECFKTDVYSNGCCVSWLHLLFGCLLRSYSDAEPHGRRGGSDFTQVLEHIRHAYRTVTLTELAERFHYSKPHLCTLIRQNTGVSFTELIKRIRMNVAVRYLLHTGLSVGEIAETVGYHSADHFSRVFRSAHGVSPQEYRRKYAQETERFVPFEDEPGP